MQTLILLNSLKDITTGVNIFEAIKHVIDDLGLRSEFHTEGGGGGNGITPPPIKEFEKILLL